MSTLNSHKSVASHLERLPSMIQMNMQKIWYCIIPICGSQLIWRLLLVHMWKPTDLENFADSQCPYRSVSSKTRAMYIYILYIYIYTYTLNLFLEIAKTHTYAYIYTQTHLWHLYINCEGILLGGVSSWQRIGRIEKALLGPGRGRGMCRCWSREKTGCLGPVFVCLFVCLLVCLFVCLFVLLFKRRFGRNGIGMFVFFCAIWCREVFVQSNLRQKDPWKWTQHRTVAEFGNFSPNNSGV